MTMSLCLEHSKCPTCNRPLRRKKTPSEKAKAALEARLRKPMPKSTVYKQDAHQLTN